MWGGVECSVNRVDDTWQDQIVLSGHEKRLTDLKLIEDLGIQTVRYPVLWERIAPHSPLTHSWEWTDERLNRMRAMSLDPVVGLLHHGSGPSYTGLLESNFPSEFAKFAGAVAQRYPWVARYTPINEPMTTARFSALYGHWYPHRRDDRSFARAFINQCRGIVLAMRAIREVNPAAELVQTEDLGTTYGTSHMSYQQQFDNERRWLTWDVLRGKVNRAHPLRPYLECWGITSEELDWFSNNPCPPDIVGINHYVTSDRYLDERIKLYPPQTHGGNARESYADLDAVRVMPEDYNGWRIIEMAAARYKCPVAVTEVHIGCTREEQVRWFTAAYQAALAARRRGCDVRAVTAWSLFGSYNWDKLLTQTNGSYEPGAYDVRAPHPRITAVGKLIQQLTADVGKNTAASPKFGASGWWQRSSKVLYGTLRALPSGARRTRPGSKKLVICGANGVLGRAFINECKKRDLPYVALTRSDFDNSDSHAVQNMLEEVRPWSIINAAGYVRVDHAESDATNCFRDNVEGPSVLAALANSARIPFVTFSSDLVFDGRGTAPYIESDLPLPLNVYGKSKVEAEQATLIFSNTLCVRSAAFFGAINGSDFLTHGLLTLRRGSPFKAISDITVSPTYLPDLVSATLDLTIDGCVGLVHLVNRGAITWANFLEKGASATGTSTATLLRTPIKELETAARRPIFSALESERVYLMPLLDDAVDRYSSMYLMSEVDNKGAIHSA